MLGSFVNHEGVVVVIDGTQDRCWLIEDLLNVLNNFDFALITLEESNTFCLVKDGLS